MNIQNSIIVRAFLEDKRSLALCHVKQQEEMFESVGLETDDGVGDGDGGDDDVDDVDFAAGAVMNTEAICSWLLIELVISYLVI